jgi:iron-sulfur cluster assembly accessory protein
MITITREAVEKVEQLLEKEGKTGYDLRVFVAGGGCSGYQYGLMFDDQRQEDDEVINAGRFNILVDGESAMLLYGAEIDYVDSLMGSGFTIRNPNVVATCACGQSFAPREETSHAHASAGGCGPGCGCGH